MESQCMRKRSMQPDVKNIDGGRAYLVLLATHVGYILFAGTSKGLGVLLPTLTERFATHTWLVGFVISFMMMLMDVSSLPAGVLTHRVPSRYILIASGTSVAVGLVISSFAQTMLQFGVFLGLFTGIGYGFTIITLEIEMSRHFCAKYACANGIATTGSSVGLFIMAPLMQYLLDSYGWMGALVILGGLSMHLVVCGTLLRVPVAQNDTADEGEPSRGEERDGSQEASVTDQEISPGKSGFSCRGFRSGCGGLARDYDLGLFKEFSFYVVVLVTCAIRFVFAAWTIYFVPHALAMGFDKIQASMFVIITASGNFAGKACHGPIVDKRLVTRRVMIGFVTTVTAVLFFLDSRFTTPAAMVIGCLVNGVAMGVATSMIQVFMKKVVGVERLPNILGWTNLISGFVKLGAGFFPGWIYDQTLSYNYSFVMIGCVSAICPLVLIVEYLTSRRSRRGAYDLTSANHDLPYP